MIDTDKYEGHTEGPWEWFEGEGHKDLQSNMAFLMFGEVGKSQYPKPADAALIADAPLLLAEVKRLHKQLVAYTDFVLWVEEYHNEVFDEYEGKDEL